MRALQVLHVCLLFHLTFLSLLFSSHAYRRKIFIDLGSNDGNSVTSFINGVTGLNTATDGSNSLKGGWEALLSGAQEYNHTKWEVIMVEANDRHLPTLTKIKDQLISQNKVSTVTLHVPTAVTTKNGYVQFIWDSAFEGSAGATTMSESRSAVGKSVLVPAVDIVTLFKREKIGMKDFVVVKMDVEGAEYNIIRRILLTGLWQYIDRLAVEWHHNAYWVFGHPGHNTSEPNYQVRLDRHLKYKKHYESLNWMIEGLDINWQFHDWGR